MINFHAQEAIFMAKAATKQFSGQVSAFQESRLPEPALPVGYAALIDACRLAVC